MQDPAPSITIAGVEDGGVYTGSVTITISIDRGSYSATLNGAAFTSGSSVETPGAYTLKVVARNGAATRTREVSFTLSGGLPLKGSAATFDVASWNLEWFGDDANGPSDDRQQMENVAEVIGDAAFDVWGLEEVVSVAWFDSLEARLPGYTGVLANAPNVAGGSTFYSAGEQKVGVLFRSSVASLQSARIILTPNNADFAGRPPLELKLRATVDGVTQDVIVIVLHMKAFSDAEGWQRRSDAAAALKAYLDATYPTQKVWVIGDWNDDVDASITSGRPTPYAAFVNDAGRYTFATRTLSDVHASTWLGSTDPIDHHLVTNEAFAGYVAGSAEAYRVDALIGNYRNTTSDHVPVLSRYRLDP